MPTNTPSTNPPPPRPTQKWTIEPVTPSTINEVLPFLNKARHEMFPTLHTQLNPHLTSWIQSGTFLIAREDASKEIIGTIGCVPYDHRFEPSLSYRDMCTVEVVRLYVVPQHRRKGLGEALWRVLRGRVEGGEIMRGMVEEKGKGVRMYLHTHPFLAGAVGFWEKRGFGVVRVEEDEVWRTTHMEMVVGGARAVERVGSVDGM